MAHKSLPTAVHPWLVARQRYHLSDAHIQMARELGLNPQKFGSLADQRQEPWKVPLAEFIAALYAKRFGKPRPDQVRSLEEWTADQARKQSAKRARRRARAEPTQAARITESDPSQT
jgi:hypothetical protein